MMVCSTVCVSWYLCTSQYLCSSVCVSSHLGVPESLYHPASMYLFLCVPNLCVLVLVYPCPWMYLSICIPWASSIKCMCLFVSVYPWIYVSQCLGIQNEFLCSNACASISFCALLSFSVFLILYMSFNFHMFLSLYVFLSHRASPNLYSLNFYMSLHLCMWSNVCTWLCGCTWASLFLCLHVPIFVQPQFFACPWTLKIQFKCIPESLYSCVWVSFSEPLCSSVCAHEFAHAILHWPFVGDSASLGLCTPYLCFGIYPTSPFNFPSFVQCLCIIVSLCYCGCLLSCSIIQ